MADRSTKIILLLIAIGLWINALIPLFRPRVVSAQKSFACKGELKANAWGGTAANIGGYTVKMDCE
jgi:hypothetical protein